MVHRLTVEEARAIALVANVVWSAAVSLPHASQVRRALLRCHLVLADLSGDDGPSSPPAPPTRPRHDRSAAQRRRGHH